MLSSRTDSLTGVSCRSNGLNMHVTTESAQRTPHMLHSQTTLNQIWPDINRLHKEVLFHIHLLTTAVLQHTLIKITNLGFLWQPAQRLCTVTDGMLLPSLQNITGSSISCRNVRLVTSDGIKRKCNKSQKKQFLRWQICKKKSKCNLQPLMYMHCFTYTGAAAHAMTTINKPQLVHDFITSRERLKDYSTYQKISVFGHICQVFFWLTAQIDYYKALCWVVIINLN